MPRTERLAPCFRASAGRIPQRRLVCLYSDATAIARIFTGRIPQRLRACSCTRFFITIHFSPFSPSHAPPEVRSCLGRSGSLPASAPPPGGFRSGGSFVCTAMRRRSRASSQGEFRSGFGHAVVPGFSSLFTFLHRTLRLKCDHASDRAARSLLPRLRRADSAAAARLSVQRCDGDRTHLHRADSAAASGMQLYPVFHHYSFFSIARSA